MKKLLLLVMFINMTLLIAQNGDTINEAIDIDGVGVAVNVLDYNSATISGLMPACGATEDVFYKHDVSSGDNKVTIGMVSAAVSLLTNIDYQILMAPNGNLGSLQEVTCDSYTVLLVAGGSFEFVIENVNEADEYFLRVYKTSGLGGVLTDLLNATSITMISEFDSSLSIGDIDESENIKFVVKDDYVKLINNHEFTNYSMYSLNGKNILTKQSNDLINSIDLSRFKSNLYVLVLDNGINQKSYKLLKR